MRHLPLPKDKNLKTFIATEVFKTCISMVKNGQLKARLQSIVQQVDTEAKDYDIKATGKQLFQKQPHNQIGSISRDEMVKVYTGRMVPKTSKGRPIYDQIMSAPIHGKCPLCGIGTVNTLDHYLPKTFFPIYSVTPNNLVPVCNWCQGKKAEYYPTTEGEQLLHPYFDDIDNDIWLVAEVIVGVPAGFRYFTSPPNYWSQGAKQRVEMHLKELDLPTLFSSNAGSRLAEIRTRLTRLYQTANGEKAVRSHLQEELISVEADQKNSWVAAMYRAAVASDWFCNGGFLGT